MNKKHRLAAVPEQVDRGRRAEIAVERTVNQLIKAAGGGRGIGLALIEYQDEDGHVSGLGNALELLAEAIEEEIGTVEDWGKRANGLGPGTAS